MVVLTLTPYRGNHTRFFPHAGYLGLTPVVIQGTVRTVVQEDRKPLKARSVVIRVRCYEADISNVAAGKGKKKTPRVLYELSQEVWSCEGEEWGLLGDWSKAWRLVLPVDAGGVTTSTFKTWRSWWQVEAGELVESFLFFISRRLLIPALAHFSHHPQTVDDPWLPNDHFAPTTPHAVFRLHPPTSSTIMVFTLFSPFLSPIQASHPATERTPLLRQRLFRRLRSKRPHHPLPPIHSRQPLPRHQKNPSQPRPPTRRRRRRPLTFPLRRRLRRHRRARGRLGLHPSRRRRRPPQEWSGWAHGPQRLAAEKQLDDARSQPGVDAPRRGKLLRAAATGPRGWSHYPPERIFFDIEQ